MKSLLLIASLCVLVFSASVGEAASAGGLVIALPSDKSFVESGLINIILKGGQSAVDEVQITVNGKKQAVAAKPLEQQYACYSGIHLSYGMNRIKVTGLKDGRKTGETTAQVFYRTELSPGSGSAPPGFKRYLFHDNVNEKECSPCHGLDFGKSGGKKQAPDRSPCYLCHKKILSDYKYVHGPAAVWSCLSCHEATSRKPKLAVVKPDDKSCTGCHEKSWDGKKHIHGPTAAGNCTTCHDPHAADKPFFLRMDAGDLCTSCHEEVLFRPHVITTFAGGSGHPLKRSPDPFNPSKDFTCVSCHNPHGSDSSVFLQAYEDSTSMQHFCRSCHIM